MKPIIQSNQPSHRGICCQSPSALHWYTRLLLPSGNRCPGRHVIFTLLSVWFNVATALSTSGAGRHRPAVQVNERHSVQHAYSWNTEGWFAYITTRRQSPLRASKTTGWRKNFVVCNIYTRCRRAITVAVMFYRVCLLHLYDNVRKKIKQVAIILFLNFIN